MEDSLGFGEFDTQYHVCAAHPMSVTISMSSSARVLNVVPLHFHFLSVTFLIIEHITQYAHYRSDTSHSISVSLCYLHVNPLKMIATV